MLKSKEEIIAIYSKQKIRIVGTSLNQKIISVTGAWTKNVSAYQSYASDLKQYHYQDLSREPYALESIKFIVRLINATFLKDDAYAALSISNLQSFYIKKYNAAHQKYLITNKGGGMIDAFGYAVSDLEMLLRG